MQAQTKALTKAQTQAQVQARKTGHAKTVTLEQSHGLYGIYHRFLSCIAFVQFILHDACLASLAMCYLAM